MNQKTYSLISGSVFLVVGFAHLARLIWGWEIAIAGWSAPLWISVLGLIVSGLLAAWGLTLASRFRPRG